MGGMEGPNKPPASSLLPPCYAGQMPVWFRPKRPGHQGKLTALKMCQLLPPCWRCCCWRCCPARVLQHTTCQAPLSPWEASQLLPLPASEVRMTSVRTSTDAACQLASL